MIKLTKILDALGVDSDVIICEGEKSYIQELAEIAQKMCGGTHI